MVPRLARPDAERWRAPLQEAAAGHTLRDPKKSARHHALWAAPWWMPFPSVEDTATHPRAPFNTAEEEASYAPENCTPEGCASADEPALAAAKGPVGQRGMTPVIMASAYSR